MRTGLTIRPKRFGNKLVAFVAVAALVLQPAYTLLAAQVANALGGTVATTNLSTWDLSETRAKGHNQLVVGGLHVWTDASDSASKAAGYYATPGLNLSDVDSTSIDFVSYTGGRPSVQIGVDRDGNGTWDGYLVYEPWAYGDGQYWVDKPNFGVSAGGGYQSMGTLAQYQTANPDAKITSIGYSLGSGVKGDAVISKITVGDTAYTFNADVPACSTTDTTFDTSTNGSVNGQHGWKSTGNYDQAVVDNVYDIASFGCKSLRISNAVTSGSFGDQTFSYSTANEAGDADAENAGLSGGVRQSHYEAQFDIASTQTAQQSGLSISVSPDRGDGARMSYLRFEDKADGIHVFFDDVTTSSNPADWNETDIATLSRTAPHTIKLSIDFANGPSNDVVKVYVDGALVKTGTSWENYYRYDDESNPTLANDSRTVDSLLFRAAGSAAPATSGAGFLIDNVNVTTSTPPPAVPTNLTWTPNGGTAKVSGTTTSVEKGVLKWSNTDGNADHYKYYFWTDIPGYFEGQANAWSTENAAYFTNTAANGSIWTDFSGKEGTYFFCVKAVSAAGSESACSNTFSVTYDKTAPMKPTLTSPVNNAVVNGASITQSWSDTSSDVDHYVYESYNNSAATNLRWHEEFSGTSKTATNVANGTTYWWRVKAVDHAGNVSPWSDLWKITVDNTAPNVSKIRINGTTIAGQYKHDANCSAIDELFDVSGDLSLTAVIDDANGVTKASYKVRSMDDNGCTHTEIYSSNSIALTKSNKNASNWNQGTAFDTEELENGKYAVVLVTEDAAGNKTTKYIHLNVENAAPTNGGEDNGETNNGGNTGGNTGGQTTTTPGTQGSESAGGVQPQALLALQQPGFTASQAIANADVLGVTDNQNSDTPKVKGASDQSKTLASTANPDGILGASDSKFFGLVWYWWLLIAAAALAAGWWIIAAARRRRDGDDA